MQGKTVYPSKREWCPMMHLIDFTRDDPLRTSFLAADALDPNSLKTLTDTTPMRVDLYVWNVQATHPHWFDSMETNINSRRYAYEFPKERVDLSLHPFVDTLDPTHSAPSTSNRDVIGVLHLVHSMRLHEEASSLLRDSIHQFHAIQLFEVSVRRSYRSAKPMRAVVSRRPSSRTPPFMISIPFWRDLDPCTRHARPTGSPRPRQQRRNSLVPGPKDLVRSSQRWKASPS